ncbi:MAG: ribosome-associated translation inhibitor RaiA [Verrucomicrobiota bacterium JB022]|nr:ribosome-associated translation inhibitor RaiA [Verrucomicrobiota bacterium JB022]
MNNRANDVIISGNHLELTDALKTMVQEKVAKLFEHESNIIRIRVELGHTPDGRKEKEYSAKGLIEIRGNDMIVNEHSHDLYKSIDGMTQKLDRLLRRRHRLARVKRKQTHAVEIPAGLPKVQTA